MEAANNRGEAISQGDAAADAPLDKAGWGRDNHASLLGG
jgi:hypothetical protein